MISGNEKHSKFTLKISFTVVHEINSGVLMAITFNTNTKFNEQIENICHQANFELHVLCRIRIYSSTEKTWILCNVFFNLIVY